MLVTCYLLLLGMIHLFENRGGFATIKFDIVSQQVHEWQVYTLQDGTWFGLSNLQPPETAHRDKPVLEHNVILFGFSNYYFYMGNFKRLNGVFLHCYFIKKAPASGGSCC